MKKIMIIASIFVIVVLAGCANNKQLSKETKDLTEEKITLPKDFLGKPSVIIFASTHCPHCKNSMPEFETKIWDKYHDKLNIFVNVVDKGKFEQKRIKQGFCSDLDFEKITTHTCGYVPSWIILDEHGNVVDESCGGKGPNNETKTIEDIETAIKKLIEKK